MLPTRHGHGIGRWAGQQAHADSDEQVGRSYDGDQACQSVARVGVVEEGTDQEMMIVCIAVHV